MYVLYFYNGYPYVIQISSVTSFVIFFWLLYSAAGDPNAWRLGRIEETDHETPV